MNISFPGLKKLIWIVLLAAVAYYFYWLLLSPPKVTLRTYQRIQQGINSKQLDSVLGAGYLRVLFKDVGDRVVLQDEVKGDEIQNECEEEFEKGRKSMSGGNPVSSTVSVNFESEEGTWKTPDAFVPAKRFTMYISSFESHGVMRVNSSAQYSFNGYLTDAGDGCKILRNGTIYFSPKAKGNFLSWKGKDGRLITVLLVGDSVDYWSYRGPANDFAKLPPLVKKGAGNGSSSGRTASK